MKVKEESEKVGLKFNIQKTKMMAPGPITSWQIDGGTMETVRDFILGGSKITADGDRSHDIKTNKQTNKKRLLLGRKVMKNLDSILKSRDITLPTKFHLTKAMVFSSSHVWVWELNYKKKAVLQKLMFLNCGVGEDECPLDCKEIQQSI